MRDPAGLDGLRAVVLGGLGTIGGAVSCALADAGAEVIVADLPVRARADPPVGLLADASHENVAELPGSSPSREFRAVDVRSRKSVEELATYIWDTGGIDTVIYAPGVNYTDHVVDTDWDEYRQLMAVNLDGAFHTAKSFGSRQLAAARGGSFTFIASTAGKRGEAGASVYCATKFGLIGLVESFADEVASNGIRVNAVCPGNVDGPMIGWLAAAVAKREAIPVNEVERRFEAASAAGRFVKAEEVASVCVWLASPAASAVMGASIVVDAATLSQ